VAPFLVFRGRQFFRDHEDGFVKVNISVARAPFADSGSVSVGASRVENRRSGFSLPVAADEAFASSPQSGLAWFCFLFPLIEPDRQISRIRLSEKTHDGPCDAVCNF
jgi:hypothetical protein